MKRNGCGAVAEAVLFSGVPRGRLIILQRARERRRLLASGGHLYSYTYSCSYRRIRAADHLHKSKELERNIIRQSCVHFRRPLKNNWRKRRQLLLEEMTFISLVPSNPSNVGSIGERFL